MRQEPTDRSPEAKRPHRRTGEPRGAPNGHARTLSHGCRSGSAVARRKQVSAILREVRELLKDGAS
jgi:hypothetical protein